MKTIGNKIKELRRSKGMSQKDIADKLGVTSQAVSSYLTISPLPLTWRYISVALA